MQLPISLEITYKDGRPADADLVVSSAFFNEEQASEWLKVAIKKILEDK
ncbi:MAG: hypothetical protein ACREOZ_02115 [Gloeomargaritales cyanobacterium]